VGILMASSRSFLFYVGIYFDLLGDYGGNGFGFHGGLAA
jgi:hypothetical protein